MLHKLPHQNSHTERIAGSDLNSAQFFLTMSTFPCYCFSIFEWIFKQHQSRSSNSSSTRTGNQIKSQLPITESQFYFISFFSAILQYIFLFYSKSLVLLRNVLQLNIKIENLQTKFPNSTSLLRCAHLRICDSVSWNVEKRN